ncbi:bifunctional UDP-N-acetylglucosamine diphosphorylase/glucosamine-1-phosphate N-acetyltransferase GlmU [Olsenella sp. HMSC062G07]|uniref:bifunctional UDP-N-acetylglucosamine diphosphorylase/glucosamine-1-phosphate N-acetyltransferase GlmU n=1 Tax=Olsenella sp. HMSC062G07 TaxID=1739330 RepID=UPI0008A12A1F|nr:bifunctional UDP-N-acetylglucosamine diphosphorylase/glucosamine-1-phosphate N-acetyltransferase GlmU [Olsenella sp. HMSC062G07]OFK24999.1 bifunctional N-acetylglucosamine-1-phosphate uridyltransferase/glucosamine-1-phosphate acetyltransferase [Olsenella sp. HMSC062G07]
MPTTAIILAAGEGTRMKSAHPKVMHPLLDRPLIWWAVRSARLAGVERIVLVVGSGAAEVRSYFTDGAGQDETVEFVEQTQRKGTGHAVLCVREALGRLQGPTVVMYGDMPLVRPETIRSLVSEARTHHNACTVLTMTPPDPSGYGRIVTGADGAVSAIVEDRDCTPEQRSSLVSCNSGLYCFCGRRLFDNVDKMRPDNAQGEYYLTDMVGILVGLGEPVCALAAEDYRELLGVNSRSQLAAATDVMRRRINERLMGEGVSMLDPSQVWVGPDVTVGPDTTLLPQTFLWGRTSVGADCTIGPNSRLTDAIIGDRCLVDESVIVGSALDDDVSCGPRAYLRGGAHLHDHAKAGTHVELKGTEVGRGSKVPHLSYLGDARLGDNVNIGGGTITCNYDGKHKSRTEIGDHVFIGSDVMLVAPVTIGDNALVGAASCITRDVPAGALSLERSRQLVKEGWADTYWERLEEED